VSAADDSELIAPRGTAVLYGHGEAEGALLDAYRGGRLPHAWLISGPAGIGKATLAYRMARFVLAHPDPRAPQVTGAQSLAIDADHVCNDRCAMLLATGWHVAERCAGGSNRFRGTANPIAGRNRHGHRSRELEAYVIVRL